MVSVHADVLLGISFGVLFGVVPAIGAAAVGAFSEGRIEGSLPRTVTVLLTLPVALGLAVVADAVAPGVDQAVQVVAFAAAVLLLALYAYGRGARLGTAVSRDGPSPVERGRALSAAALESTDASGQVTVRPVGAVERVEGYPELPADVRERIADSTWRLPADLPLSELEDRIETRLRTEFDLPAVSVSVDERGRASVAAAPPVQGLAGRVPEGYRAVSVAAVLPDGIAPGDEVTVHAEDGSSDGVLLSVAGHADGATGLEGPGGTTTSAPEAATPPAPDVRATRSDGDGPVDAALDRVTVAVPTEGAEALLGTAVPLVAVHSRDTRPDFRALSLLEEADRSVRVVTLSADLLDAVSGDDEVAVLAARPPSGDDRGSSWQIAPETAALEPDWEAFLAAPPATLRGIASTAPATDGVVQS